ncbi:unnamed protein product [Eruca vesicaria subsp. sativa]|uniref:Uncharacterized protein n=1 Tax=Eruca vesicaria subsp. sativa TaxID=29727 RepID=A0ABC8L488_ERUVS|nr:unnamed protein product [Eruca vesicaria subsp. sativa]
MKLRFSASICILPREWQSCRDEAGSCKIDIDACTMKTTLLTGECTKRWLEISNEHESIEVTSKLCGEVISLRYESTIDEKPEIFGSRPEGIGASSVIIEVKPEICDANFDGVDEPAVKESELVVSKPMEDGTGSVACLTMNLDEPELKRTDLG